MKTNQDGGGESSTAAAGELKNNQKIEGGARKGAAKKKPDANGDGIPDYAQDGIGASRMGYNQSFGAGKANCYAKGAAKVAEIMGKGPAQNTIYPSSESLEMAAREGLLANTKQATSLGFVNSNFDPKSKSYSAKPVGVETFETEKFLDGGNKPYKIRDPKAMKAFSKDSTSLAQRNKLEARTLNSLMDKENKKFGM